MEITPGALDPRKDSKADATPFRSRRRRERPHRGPGHPMGRLRGTGLRRLLTGSIDAS